MFRSQEHPAGGTTLFIKKRIKTKSGLGLGILLFVFSWADLELFTRCQGVIDFPIYQVDQEIGYIPRASQEGSLVNRFTWKVNEKNMTSGSWAPNQKPDLLLIGDSIVWGGEEYRHGEKLGTALQDCLPLWSVWSVGASGWSIPNEAEYLRRNPEVVEATDLVVWVLNSGDFAPKAQFLTDANTPRSRPWSANLYAIRKYILPAGFKKWLRSLVNRIRPSQESAPSDPAEAERELTEAVDALHAKGKPILILAYPSRAELGHVKQSTAADGISYEHLLARIEKIKNQDVQVVDGRSAKPLKIDDYRDDIHPTAEGNAKLARFLAQEINGQMPVKNHETNQKPPY